MGRAIRVATVCAVDGRRYRLELVRTGDLYWWQWADTGRSADAGATSVRSAMLVLESGWGHGWGLRYKGRKIRKSG